MNTSSLSDGLFGALTNFRNAVAAAKESENPDEKFDVLADATEKPYMSTQTGLCIF